MILLLQEYANWAKANDQNHNLTLLTTSYPFYLVRRYHWIQLIPYLLVSKWDTLTKSSAFSMFMTNGQIPIRFRQELKEFSKNMPHVTGVVQEFSGVGSDFWEQREFILEKTEQAFKALSDSIVTADQIRWILAESRDPGLYPVASQVSLTNSTGVQKYTSHYKPHQKVIIYETNEHFDTIQQTVAKRLSVQMRGVLHGRSRFSQFSAYSQELRKPGTARATIMADLGVRGHPDLRYIPEGYSMDEKDSQDRTYGPLDIINDKSEDNSSGQATPVSTSGRSSPAGSAEMSFYLYSSDVLPVGGATNVQALTSAGSPTEKVLNEFIMALHRGVLGLESRPTADSTVGVELNDELLLWMKLCLNAEKMSLVLDEKSSGSGFVLSLPFNQTYKTKDIALPIETPLLMPPSLPGVEQPQPAADSSGSLGIFADRNFMVLSLDESKVVDEPTLNLGEVLNRSSLDSIIPALNSPAMTFVKVLPLKLDTAPDARNWITFFPEANYLTVVRNQYISTTQVFNDFLKWMGLEEKYFSIEKITAITKKRFTWTPAPTGAGVNIQPEFILGLTCRMKPSGAGAGYTVTGAIWFMDDTLELSIVLQDGLPIGELLAWAVNALKLKDFTLSDILENAQNLKTPLPRRVAIRFGLNKDGTISGIRAVNIDLTMSFQTAKSPVLTLFTYQWTQGAGSTFTGSLWCSKYLSTL